MKTYAETVKDTLFSLIHRIAEHPWLYSRNPECDFTRDRKLTFEKMLTLLVSMGGDPIRDELMDHFDCTPDMASVSAFVQQRSKILPEALEFLFQQFTNICAKSKLYNGYRLLAADGSDIQFSADPNDKMSYFPGSNGQKHYSLLHLNGLYDLETRTYLDAVVHKRKISNENGALVQMVERLNDETPTIVIADRAYEAYNTMAHIERKGWKYLIRMREKGGILTPFSLPQDGEMDRWMKVVLTKKWNKQVIQLAKEHPGMYRFLNANAIFDFLDAQDKVNIFYPMIFRIVRFQLTEDSWETVITNLDEEQFPPEELKKLYHRRWGIETSFRQLKHTVGLKQLQSKKVEHVIQEIFARLVMYNFSELIASHAIIQNKTGKFIYQINFSAAVHICRQFLRGSVSPPHVEALISRYITPIRPGRNAPRKLKPNTFKGFLYRIA